MLISNLNFKISQYNKLQDKDFTFEGRKPKLAKVTTDAVTNTGKNAMNKLLISLTAFAAANGLNYERTKKAAESGNLDMVGKKVDSEGEKTQEYLKNLELRAKTHVSRNAFGKLVGINLHSVNWHIAKGTIEVSEDGTIDITNEKNKYFLENFEKGATKQLLKYTIEDYDKLQKKLGAIKIDYCLARGFLVADENGIINVENPINKEFLEKVEKREITVWDFYLSRRDFARLVKQGDMTLNKAIKDGKVIVDSNKGVDITHPINKAYIEEIQSKKAVDSSRKRRLPDGYISRQELADKLGVTLEAVSYHIKVGHLVSSIYGIDLNNPINDYFINNYVKGAKTTISGEFSSVLNQPKSSKKMVKPNHVTQSKFAKRLGLSQATLKYHIFAGHVIHTPDGIDLTHPQNIHFLNNYKRGETYQMPNAKKEVKKQARQEQKSPRIIQTNFNHLLKGEIAKMLKYCQSVISFYFDKGQLEKTGDNKFDLENPVNKTFIESRANNIRAKYSTMSNEDLQLEVDNLKSLLKNRISYSVYKVSSDLLEAPEDLLGYLKYSLGKIVDVSNLDNSQQELLASIFKETVLADLASKDLSTAKVFESDKKLDIMTYKYLLDEILLRKSNSVGVSANDIIAPVLIEGNTVVDVDSKIDEMIEDFKMDYAKELADYEKVLSKKTEVLADAYLLYKFKLASQNYEKLMNFNETMRTEGLPMDVEEERAQRIFERLFLPAKYIKKFEEKAYFYWKKDNMPKNAEEFVLTVLEQYKNSLLSKICNEETLEKIKKLNPKVEITLQDLEDIVNEKLDLY